MTIPKISKFVIVDKPAGIGVKMRNRHRDLIDALRILANDKTIKTSLKELGYKNIPSARYAIRNVCKKHGIDDAYLDEFQGEIHVFRRG